MSIKLTDLLNWSEPKRVETRNGPRNLRTAKPDSRFWSAWKQHKQFLKDNGISCSKAAGDWQACWWMPLDETEQTALRDATAASRATTSDATIPAPAGCEYLPYQKAGIAYGLDKTNVLIADEMGLGKTIQSIGIWNADEKLKNCLIVCPASLRLNWQREFEKWSVRPVKVGIVSGGKLSDWPKGGCNVFIINFDVLQKHRTSIDAMPIDLLIVDEVHYAKNPKAIRTRAVFGWKTKKGDIKQLPIDAKRRVYLTGTPMPNRPIELWPLVESLDPAGMGKSFFGFAKRYTNATHNGYGWDFSGATRLDELQRRLREKFMVRRLKNDVLTELPAKRRQVIELPVNGAGELVKEELMIYENHKAYLAELDERIAEYERQADCELKQLLDENSDYAELRAERAKALSIAFTEMSKARHAVALAKVPHVIEHLETALEGGPVIVFAHHLDVVAQIKAAFSDRSVVLTGATSMNDRQAAVDDFQNGKADLFIGNIKAAGVGITLTKSSHVVFAELDWTPSNLNQCEDRAHRIGQVESVLIQHLVLEGSVDSLMVHKLVTKQEVIDQALDRREEPKPVTEVDCNAEIKVGETVKAAAIEIVEEKVESEFTEDQIKAAHYGLQIIAGVCDGAHELDGCGFNKVDTNFGKSLAMQPELSPGQARWAVKLTIKYGRQLPADLLERIKGK